MVNNEWFLEALLDLRKFAAEEGINNIFAGLAVVIENFCIETGMTQMEVAALMKDLSKHEKSCV